MNGKIFPPILIFLVFGYFSDTWGQKTIYQAFPKYHRANSSKEKPPAKLLQSVSLSGAFIAGQNVHTLGGLNADQIGKADGEAKQMHLGIKPKPPRVGLVRAFDSAPLSFGKSGKRFSLPDGKNLTTMAVHSPGAFGIRLHIRNFDFSSGSLLVYGYEGKDITVHGPYTGKGPQGTGEFWTPTTPGDKVYIELTETESIKGEIFELLHRDKEISEASPLVALECHLDVMCRQEDVNSSVRDAIGRMEYIKEGNGYLCTGTLLNSSDPETSVPYFLTARHCLSTQQVADTLEVTWFYQTNDCNGTVPSLFSLPRSNRGRFA